MPAPVTSPSSPRTVSKTAALKPRSQVPVKKTRIVRRRGRTQGDIGSDDEIERELGTDSESEDELSSLDSASDSDTEPASDDVIHNGHAHAFTPSTSQSPGDRAAAAKEPLPLVSAHVEPFFTPAGNWSEMVADETANGPADLPVIEFADFDGQDTTPAPVRPRKTKKLAKNARPLPESAAPAPAQPAPSAEEEMEDTEQVASTSRHSPSLSFSRRAPGQTARQAYQQRLESDPSYVPTVGGFWGHDDRLLDKDLRSLSGWWRGRWQGRGRGRGFIRGRGRGGFYGPTAAQHGGEDEGQEEDAGAGNSYEVPPIERAWTHDGFEEMKEREEQRRAAQRAQPTSSGYQANGFRGGRGVGPVRGGRGGYNRGGFAPSPARQSFGNSGRVWYQMKPELMWTKQHEGFLYFDIESTLRPRPGQGPGILVKLPGKQAKVIRASLKSHPIVKASIAKPATPSVNSSDAGEKTYAVRLPKRSGKEKEVAAASVETPIDDVFKVRPSLVSRAPRPSPEKTPFVNGASTVSGPSNNPSRDASFASLQSQPDASIRSQLEQLSVEPEKPDPARRAQTEEAVLRNPPTEPRPEEYASEAPHPDPAPAPVLPALQTMFTPPASQPSPVYGSPYGYTPTLPPGIAMNQHGMPYELATGRPVYLQAPPQPQPMYTPRPPPGVPFMHHHHLSHHTHPSPDFLAAAPRSPPAFIDPATGAPIFAFPRPTTRIEIRAPDGGPASAPKSASTKPLRTAAAAFVPSTPADADPAVGGYFAAPYGGDAEGEYAQQYAQQQQHQYYYPEPYYAPYVDMSQVSGYDMYPPADGTVYY